MDKRLFYGIALFTAISLAVASYVLVAGWPFRATLVQADYSVIPANPLILYLAPQGSSRGKANDQSMQARGATQVANWQGIPPATNGRLLDALVIDDTMLNSATPTDVNWLQAQFRNGVTLVGLGIEDERFAKVIGVQNLVGPGESSAPIGPTGYRLVLNLVAGKAEDINKLGRSSWFDDMVRGSRPSPLPSGQIKFPMTRLSTKSRGTLDTEEGLAGLFFMMQSSIESVYNARSLVK